ncbi:MAG TPA: efflux RND transporter periplasmic adaptor subunit, partial [Bacteroidota bacterium]|nr:efflux RND transporter periplasmic adaptor subunit [Bacteroidota bacterium]
VWLQMDVYESDIASIRVGQTISATVEAYPSEQFHGTITFIGASVEPSTRTIRVRATLKNPEYRLMPEMFAQTTILIPLARSIVVPAGAILSTGRSTVVWVEGEANHFSARSVKLGFRAGDQYQVLEGLNEGEKVAVTGTYLLDSESQLQVSGGAGDR